MPQRLSARYLLVRRNQEFHNRRVLPHERGPTCFDILTARRGLRRVEDAGHLTEHQHPAALDGPCYAIDHALLPGCTNENRVDASHGTGSEGTRNRLPAGGALCEAQQIEPGLPGRGTPEQGLRPLVELGDGAVRVDEHEGITNTRQRVGQ